MRNILKYNSRQLAIAAVCFLVITSLFVVPVFAESGSCGKGVSWKLNNGVLTISGKGKMNHFSDNNWAPWYELRTEIVEVRVSKGVTNIGNAAFYDCSNLKTVVLNDTVETIGQYAFLNCENLVNIKIGNGVKTIGDYAFKLCKSLISITLPNTLEYLGYESFFNCESLVSIKVPSSVIMMKECVFTYCYKLVQAYIGASISELPEWTFYGCDSLVKVVLSPSINSVDKYSFHDCDNLTEVTSGADSDTCKDIKNQIKKDVPDFDNVVPGNTDGNFNTKVNPSDGDTVQKDANEDDDVAYSGEYDDDGSSKVDATVKDEDGWSKLDEKVADYVDKQEGDFSKKPVVVNVTVENGGKVPGSIFNHYAGKNVIFTIKGKVTVSINCSELNENVNYKDFYLDFMLSEIQNPTKADLLTLGNTVGYYLEFSHDINMKLDVHVSLGDEFGHSYITLFRKKGGNWIVVQTVRADEIGTGTFYLDGIGRDRGYLIGIDVEGYDTNSPYLPNELFDDYGGLTDGHGNKYALTGVKSKWGISIGQFSIIIFAVVFAVVAGIGAVMFMMNKRRIANEKIRQEVMSESYSKENHIKNYKFMKKGKK